LRKSRRFMVGSGCGASLGARFQGLDRQAREARQASTTRPENVRESGVVKSGYALWLNQSGKVRAEPGMSVRGGNEQTYQGSWLRCAIRRSGSSLF
jgi:hypothetical protein